MGRELKRKQAKREGKNVKELQSENHENAKKIVRLETELKETHR